MLWFDGRAPKSRVKGPGRVSAITQLRPDSSGSSDLALLFAAFQAFPGSLAVVDSGVVLYANPAWAQMFESGDQVYGRPVEDFIPGHLFRAPTAGRTVREFVPPENLHSYVPTVFRCSCRLCVPPSGYEAGNSRL
jgi:PAS domain-containing protein